MGTQPKIPDPDSMTDSKHCRYRHGTVILQQKNPGSVIDM
jgi:hypothetical protein